MKLERYTPPGYSKFRVMWWNIKLILFHYRVGGWKRPYCWIFKHDWKDEEVGEYWIDSETIGTHWQEYCNRCYKKGIFGYCS